MEAFLPGQEVEEILLQKDETRGERKRVWDNFQITAGVSNNGAEMSIKKKNSLSEGDMAKLSLNKGFNLSTYNLTYQLPFILTARLPLFLRSTPLTFIDLQPCNLYLAYQVDSLRTKHEYYEKSWIGELAFINTPWRIKFE